ncbi:MAG: hypothetical protein K940chlam3_01082 [Chlamydiae bacterium]|nr:hypothetical protein [Chlamydiota bacterium]
MPIRPHRNYLNDESILMQLILNEYIKSCRVMKPTLRLLKKELHKGKWTRKDLKYIFEEIESSIIAVGGHCKKPMFSTPWSHHLGHLEKLEDFSYLLVMNTESNNPTFYALHQDIQTARESVKQFLRLLQLWSCQSSLFYETIDPKQVHASLEDLYEHIKGIAFSLSVALEFSVKNENVALYFLRHHKEISTQLGRRFTRETLQKLFPKGAAKAQIELKRKLKKRGFDNLIDELPQLFKEVKIS